MAISVKKTVQSKYLKPIVSSLLLIFLWLFLIFFHVVNSDLSYTIISKSSEAKAFDTLPKRELLAGDKISGIIEVKDNYLGIIILEIDSFDRINKDIVVFRLRELGKDNWYYERNYDARQFLDMPFYPFGFPVIKNSKGKFYQFEIESRSGKAGNAIALGKNQIIITKHQYPKENLFNNYYNFIDFFKKKFVNAYYYYDLLFSSLIYLLPFIFYLLWLIIIRKSLESLSNAFLKRWLILIKICPWIDRFVKSVSEFLSIEENKNVWGFMLLFILGMLFDIFFIKYTYGLIILIMGCLWVLLIKKFKFKSIVSFTLSFLLLIGCMILIVVVPKTICQKMAVWIYFFLIIGIAQNISEIVILERSVKL